MRSFSARTVSAAPAAAAPAQAPLRLRDVDALRGFALLGILVVNSTYLATSFHGSGVEDPAFSGALDDAARWLVAVLFETKFFLLFSFLFGYSFTLQLDSAARRGVAFRPRFLRRLAGLYAIGLFHAIVLFPGDILTTYAVLGLVLLALRNLSPRRALIAAGALLLVTAIGYAVLAAVVAASGGGSIDVAAATEAAQRSDAALRGGPLDVIAEHLRQLPDIAFLLAFFQAPAALAAFLVGLAAGKRRVFADVTAHARTLRRIQAIGFPVGLAGGLLYAHASLVDPGGAYQLLSLGIDVLVAPALAAAYGATLLRALHGRGGARLSAALAPAGQMALTNYLTQSLVCALVFTGLGLGLVGDLGPAAVLTLAVAIFAAQLALSARWMRGHRYGPLEWLLRAFTNLERPPWRRGEPG